MPSTPENLRCISLRQQMRRLRKHAPLCAPIRVRQQIDPRCHGELCIGRMDTRVRRRDQKVMHFTLVLERRLSAGEKYDCVLHEWAHALDRATRLNPKDCHDTRWGQCYSRAFNAMHKA